MKTHHVGRWKRLFTVAAPFSWTTRLNRNGWGTEISNGTSVLARSRPPPDSTPTPSEYRDSEGQDSSWASASQVMVTQAGPSRPVHSDCGVRVETEGQQNAAAEWRGRRGVPGGGGGGGAVPTQRRGLRRCNSPRGEERR
jgi:hypothetical protein